MHARTVLQYLWAYITALVAGRSIVLYGCQPEHSDQYARDVLERWHGTLVVDGYVGYQALFDNG
ncbi:hypothetical protein CRN79_17900 [Serratia fonticola]|uniref:IS66 family transposase n=1 Tax=Serratia fonticola TaxID=47917 RepID=UPI000BFE0B6D|nr:hypothetical protein CRN79_17900 [Serratia fonticola]